MGAKIESEHKYAAFISYAHADEKAAKKLHVALETYPLPKGMDKAERSKLFPVFRDVTELTAHHSLSEKIRDAVKTSRFLIVLCSPAAKKSHWVNEEIKLFRELHGEGSILAVIVDGVPDTAFPPALTADGREPLAANMATNEGFHFGVTQLAASMLGVGLDRLVQRDQRRRRIRTQLVTGVSTALAIIMGGLAWTAIDARDDAEVALGKAEVSRNEAEKMVEFMIGDLKNDLTPIQKLHLFDNIGKRVSGYYDGIPFADMDDDRLMRKARTLHLLGDVELNRGNYEKAEELLRDAYLITEDIYIRNSENTDAIFSHAQSEYWMGESLKKQGNYLGTLKFWERYYSHSRKLLSLDPGNVDFLKEAAWGAGNFAWVNNKLENQSRAEVLYKEAILGFEGALKIEENSPETEGELANFLDGASQNARDQNNIDASIELLSRSSRIYSNLAQKYNSNNFWKYRYFQTAFRLTERKGETACSNVHRSTLLKGMFDLVRYEPQNINWQRELYFQWSKQILNCSHTPSSMLSEFNSEAFFNQSEKFSSDKVISVFRNRVKNSPN